MFSASEKREAMEKKLRAKLEEEVREVRAERDGGNVGFVAGVDNLEELRRKFREAEEKVNF
jgi:hypothetical protein